MLTESRLGEIFGAIRGFARYYQTGDKERKQLQRQLRSVVVFTYSCSMMALPLISLLVEVCGKVETL
jgi:hypothetical protein